MTLRSNGAIVHQPPGVQDELDNKEAEIVGQSSVEFGKKFVVLYNRAQKLTVAFKFGSNGLGEIAGKFANVKDDIRNSIRGDESIQSLA